MQNKLFFLVILGVAASGFILGRFTFSNTVSGNLSAIERKVAQDEHVGIGDYSRLPCPTEAEFQNLAKEVNLVIPEGPSFDVECKDGHRALMGKSLFLMQRLKINFPENWPEKLKEDLGKPFAFLKKHSAKLTLDLSQKDSLAYNKVTDREIYLGGRYFSIDPLDGISVLIHEARHSDKRSPMHFVCEAGDLPRATGACDDEFSMDEEKAGAYSYGALFEAAMSLYGEGLSKAEREALLISSIVQIGARFNTMPEALARKVDVLVVLTADNKLEIVHPFLNYSQTLDLKFGSPEEQPRRIEFSPVANGLFIYTNKNRIWTWSQLKGLQRFFPEVLSEEMEILNIARVRVPFKEITQYLTLGKANDLQSIEYDPKANKRLLFKYPMNLGKSIDKIPSFSQFFLALYNESVFLSQDGRVYFAPQYGNDQIFFEPEPLTSSQRWISGTGGVLYDSLYLVNGAGELKTVGREIREEHDDRDQRIFSLKDSVYGKNLRIKKFAEGLRLRMALSQEGSITVWPVEESPGQGTNIKLEKTIVDFAITQVTETTSSVGVPGRLNAEFKTRCQISTLLSDPWTGRGMGLSSQGQIVMAGAPGGAPCVDTRFEDLSKARPYLDRQ